MSKWIARAELRSPGTAEAGATVLQPSEKNRHADPVAVCRFATFEREPDEGVVYYYECVADEERAYLKKILDESGFKILDLCADESEVENCFKASQEKRPGAHFIDWTTRKCG